MKPRLVELMNFKAPAGFHASVEAAAQRRGLSISEFIRQAIAQSIANDTNTEARPTSSLRGATLEKVDDIITDAILNPDHALMLLRKVPAKPTKRDSITFAQSYRRATVLPSEHD